ncbi:unnamed protein product [Spirodela intermedia]|uniref:Exostosin GT47 domain-containing protein n=1 Tax=Spirodela intermedia TaxID=51605 RepID=A0A7I8LHP1_SPIIN|nr:unnamed protein product [Spirodela intermedia]
MAKIQQSLSRLRNLCRSGIRAHVLAMLLIAVVVLGFENSAIFSRKGLPHDPGQSFSATVSFPRPGDSEYSGEEDFSVPLIISEPDKDSGANGTGAPEKVKILNNSSPGTEKLEISNGTSSPPAGSPAVRRKKRRSQPLAERNSNGTSFPGPEKLEIADGTSSPPVGSPVNEGAAVRKTERESRPPPRSEETDSRDCARERDPRRPRGNVEPVRTIREMSEILMRNRRSSCSLIPRWSSPADQQILQARREILNAPIVEDDPELYPLVYRNFSTFKRSYELMEKMLKVYVYKEGKRPIFHEPRLAGIYAAEGWFMKHMEGKNRFLVDDPSKAHLFYMPFSSTNLRIKLYIPNSHSKGNMINYLRDYVATIAAKYPFWNRTGGADHFSVGCHDWASKLTALSMGDTIRAVCNADIAGVFELGKDVSITLTPVRNPRNPLQNVGGKPGRKRDTLAFFAGQTSHGYVRPLLLQQWGNGDPDIKVFGSLPKGGRTYAEHMKSSRYCLCPRGYEVNSPRLAETFFYECVPVIISDNFVPPFFDVLNWEAFSVVVAVKDIPRLKEILESIPRKKYLALQTGVKKVQRHFLWHSKPERYDLFHTTLHSIWFNRVLQFRDQEPTEVS